MQTKLTLVSLLEKFPKPGHGQLMDVHSLLHFIQTFPLLLPPPRIIDTYS